MLKNLIFLLPIALLTSVPFCKSENVATTKVFIIPIDSNLFNWTTIEPDDEFEYSASLVNAPDLPKWIEYSYSRRHRTGFLYGVPPKDQESLQIEVVGLNKMSYETRRRVLHLNVLEKLHPATRQIHLKIDNVNVDDFFDSYRMNRLLDIFRFKLWKESFADLYCTFLTSAVSLGARLPLRPSEGEGVVIRFGSTAPYSNTLIELQEEVKPLWKLQHCPRDFKRTTVERYFRDEGFILDWCNFRLLDETMPLRKPTEHIEEASPSPELYQEPVWYQPTKKEVSQRSYAGEFAFTILIPMLIMIVLVVLLSVIIGLQHEGISKRKSEMVEVTPSPSGIHRAGTGLRGVNHDWDGVGRSRTSSPQTGLRATGGDGLSRPTPPPYSSTMRTAVVDF
ncbi:UNVERIFIED_CONTAM: hypothetical protein PYX00_004412 [Menopon gallinae]|uniref:Epsilon-sarcoglycan n=1 Tax=Menopon gallinae TaxID=328185 RepID=A0AAW2I5K8_9NEOP